jgi:predicted amidophosphoribosyltransferase
MFLAAGRTDIHNKAVFAVRGLVNAPRKTRHLWKHLCVNCWPDVNWAVAVRYCNVCLKKVKIYFSRCSFLGCDCMWPRRWISAFLRSTLLPSSESNWG